MKIYLTNEFLYSLTERQRNIYFYLFLEIDEERFVRDISILRRIKANEEDIKVLLEKKYIVMDGKSIYVVVNEFERELLNGIIIKEYTFKKPDLEEIKKYISDKGYRLDGEYFYNFYESKGWKIRQETITNWKALIDAWNSKDNRKSKYDSVIDGAL